MFARRSSHIARQLSPTSAGSGGRHIKLKKKKAHSSPALVTDGATITVSKLPDGKFQASTLAWTDPAVILRDQVVEIRARNGRLYLLRRDKVMEPEDSSGFEDRHNVTDTDEIADL